MAYKQGELAASLDSHSYRGAASSYGQHSLHTSYTQPIASQDAFFQSVHTPCQPSSSASWLATNGNAILNVNTIGDIVRTLHEPSVEQQLAGHINGILAIIKQAFGNQHSVTQPRVNELLLQLKFSLPGAQLRGYVATPGHLDPVNGELEVTIAEPFIAETCLAAIQKLGPLPVRESASLGKAPKHTRWVCVFCRNRKRIFTRSSDLRGHLREDHNHSSVAVEQVFAHESWWECFGPYKEHIVKGHGWQVRPANEESERPKITENLKKNKNGDCPSRRLRNKSKPKRPTPSASRMSQAGATSCLCCRRHYHEPY